MALGAIQLAEVSCQLHDHCTIIILIRKKAVIRNKLVEFKKVRQDQGSFRRLFIDDLFMLYIWYTSKINRKINGFQLIYGEKAITWLEGEGLSHRCINDAGWYNPTPILSESAGAIPANIVSTFKAHASDLEKDILEYILQRLEHISSKT